MSLYPMAVNPICGHCSRMILNMEKAFEATDKEIFCSKFEHQEEMKLRKIRGHIHTIKTFTPIGKHIADMPFHNLARAREVGLQYLQAITGLFERVKEPERITPHMREIAQTLGLENDIFLPNLPA